MKKMVLGWALISLASLAIAQEKGINFEQTKSWKQVKASAKAENKFIFVDVYAAWCVKCKAMDKNVYPSGKVGAFMNDKFISVKVQGHKTDQDDASVQAWYDDAQQLVDDYAVPGYPTFLFFTPDGLLAKQSLGELNADDFIRVAGESIELANTHKSNIEKFNQDRLSPSEIKELALHAREIRDIKTAQSAAAKYIDNYLLTLPKNELFVKDTLRFISKFLGGPESKSYQFFKKHPGEINAVLGEYQAQYSIMNYIDRNYLPQGNSWEKTTPDWNTIEKNITKQFGPLGKEIVYSQRMIYYAQTKNWKEYATWYKKYLADTYKHPRYDINSLSWTLFENSNDKEVLKFACDVVMKYAMEKWYSTNGASYDTYANLLYRLGRRDQALSWQEKAVKLSNNDKEIVENLDKMKKGEKTWKD